MKEHIHKFQIGDIVRIVRPWPFPDIMPGNYPWWEECNSYIGFSGFIKETEYYPEGEIYLVTIKRYLVEEYSSTLAVHESMIEVESNLKRIELITALKNNHFV